MESGAEVTVLGTLSGKTLTAGSIWVTKDAPAPSSGPTGASGAKTVLVINVVWPGAALQATAAQEQNFLFGKDSRTLASYYRDVSYGQLTWSGTQTPNYRITDPGGCDLYTLAERAETAATQGGYLPLAYDAVIINAPNLYCGASGYGEIGGRTTWIQNGLWNLDDGYAAMVPIHEIGHSLGMYHSHGLECGTVTVDAACLDSAGSHNEEYGNAWDAMGNNWPAIGHDSVSWLSAKQEIRLGWLSGPRVAAVSTSGTYSLAPLEKSTASSPQALVIHAPSHTYYVEYRQPISHDTFMAAYPAAINSVHVNVSAASGGDDGPFALDFTPSANAKGDYNDWFDAPLAMGRSFSDPENSFTLSPVSQDGTTATVNVSFTNDTSYPLSVTSSGSGSGTVTSSPAGISCGSTCSASYSPGRSVTLTATPTAGATFAGWSGACSGTAATCTVSMSAARFVFAGFTATTGTAYEESAAALDGWRTYSDGGGTYRASKVTGSVTTFAFSGDRVSWLTRQGPAQGKASVSIDGVARGIVDTYDATWQPHEVFFGGLTSSSHTIEIKVLGRKNSSSAGDSVAVNGFNSGITARQNNTVTPRYGSWRAVATPAASGGAYRSSATPGRTATFGFTGTGVDWVTATGPGWGKAKVFIDGVDKGTMDLYAPSQRYQRVKTYQGLPAGRHTIAVKVLGKKNPSATATKVSVDAFVVH